MIRISRKLIDRISILTIVMFLLSTFSVYAQTPQVTIPVNTTQPIDVSILNNVIPELNTWQSNLRTAQSTIKTLEKVATPIYNNVAPSGMEAMTVGERIKGILSNAKTLLGSTLKSSSAAAKTNMDAGTSLSNLPVDQQLAYSVEQLGVQAAKIQTSGKTAGMMGKLKSILDVIKTRLNSIVSLIRAKIFAVGQRVGLISKDKTFKDGKVQENKGVMNTVEQVQYADSFSGKLSKGVSEGVQNAKSSLKNSFSFSNLAVTTTVAIGTNIAIDMIHGEKPSFKKAVKSVASLEFAGNVAGAALGAAGGQFASTLVKTFIPGPVGALVGSVIPVMFASASGQMGSNLISGLKNGNFSVSQAWSAIDKTDLVGSSIGSTIGMALGAPIPIVGPIIGGILGGMLGSKIAKWVTGFSKGGILSMFKKKGSTPSMPVGSSVDGSAVSTGNYTGGTVANGTGPTTYGGSSIAGVNSAGGVAGELKEVEQRYYDTYLQYNRLVESGDHEKAKEVFSDLKKYSDEYTNLKKQIKSN